MSAFDAIHPSAYVPVPSDFAYLNTAHDPARMRAAGLNGVTAVNPRIPGGLPSSPYASEPAGDAPQQDIPARFGVMSTRELLPSIHTLDYVSKFSSASLFTLGLVLLLIYFVRNPRRAARGLARGSLKRAGVED
jgi:hypothetical protein